STKNSSSTPSSANTAPSTATLRTSVNAASKLVSAVFGRACTTTCRLPAQPRSRNRQPVLERSWRAFGDRSRHHATVGRNRSSREIKQDGRRARCPWYRADWRTVRDVCVVGLGLIGGSVLRAAAKADRQVWGA